MADELKRDILLLIRSEYDGRGIDKALKDIERFEARLGQIASQKIQLQVAGTQAVAGQLRQVSQAAGGVADEGQRAGTNLGNALAEAEKRFGTTIQDLRTVRRELKATQAEGGTQFSETLTLQGPRGIQQRINPETGDQTFTQDIKKANREIAQAQDEAQRELDARLKRQLEARQKAEQEKAKLTEKLAREDAARQAEVEKEQDQSLKRQLQARLKADREKEIISERLARDEANREKQAAKEQERNEKDRIRRLRDADALAAQFEKERASKQRASSASATFDQVSRRPGALLLPDAEVLNRQTGQLEKVQRVLDPTSQKVFQLNTHTKTLTASTNEFNRIMSKSGDTLQNAAGKVLLWTVATGAVFGTIRAIQGSIRTFSEIEAGTIALARVGRGFTDAVLGTAEAERDIAEGARAASEEILRLKVAFGSSGTSAQEAAVTFARLGLNQQQVVEATRTSLLAANVAGIDAGQAAKFLAAAMQQFQLSAADLPDVLNKLNTLENTTRIRTEDLLHSISRAGAVIREAGGDLEFLAAVTAAVGQATGRSGAEIGNAMKTIASRLGDAGIQAKVFAATGVAIRDVEGNLKPINDVLGELVLKFQNLSDAERAQVTTTIAGIRQRNILQAALDNYFTTQAQVIRQLQSAGSAEAENEQILGTLESRIQRLIAAFERFASVLGESVAGDSVKALVDGMRLAVDGLSNLGASGLLVVGMLGAYAAAVLLASVTADGFAKSIVALSEGFTKVNALLKTSISLHLTQAGASKAAAASTSVLALSFGGLTAGIRAAAISMAAFLVTAAPLLVFAAILAGIVALLEKTRNVAINPLQEGSSANEALKRTSDAVKQENNRTRALEKTADLAQKAGAIIQDTEAKRASGIQLSTRELAQLEQANRALLEVATLEADQRERAARNALTTADATDIAAKNSKRAKDNVDAERKAIRSAIAERERQERELLIQLQKQEKAGRTFGGFLFAPKDSIFDSADTSIEKTRKSLAAVRNEQEEFRNSLRDLEAGEIEKTFGSALTDVALRISDIKESVSSGFFLAIGLETDPITKARLELEQLLDTRDRIAKDPIVLTDPEARRKELEDLNRRGTEIAREIELRQKLVDVEDRINIAKRASAVERDLITARAAETARPEDQPIARADAEIEAAKRNLDRLTAINADFRTLQEAREAIATASSRRVIAEYEAEGLRIKQALEEQKRVSDRQLDIARSVARFGVTAGEEATRPIREAKALIEVERRAFEQLTERLVQLRLKAQDSGLTRQERLEQRDLATRAEEAANRIEEAKLSAFKAQLDVIKKITEERVRQAEQTRKELGQLSDLDLARTRILAGQVKRGEVKQLTQEQFLSLDQETRQILTKFQDLFPGTSVLPDNLDLGLGEEAFSKRLKDLPLSHEQAVMEALKELPEIHREAVLEALKVEGVVRRTPEEQFAEVARRAIPDQGFQNFAPQDQRRGGIFVDGERQNLPARQRGIFADGEPFNPPAPDAAQDAANARASINMNFNIDTEGLEAQGERIATAITLELTEKLQQMIDTQTRRVNGNADALKFRIPTRT